MDASKIPEVTDLLLDVAMELALDLTAELRELVEPFRVTPVPLELLADLVFFAAASRMDVKAVSTEPNVLVSFSVHNLNVKGDFKPLSNSTVNLIV
jgi:hypothetical protein